VVCTATRCWRINDGARVGAAATEIAYVAREPMPVPTIAGVPAIRQVSTALRVGCALTETGEVWCWSDPKQPRKRAVPPDVVDIAVIDPFALCVRTRAGEVSCTPAVATTGDVLCDVAGVRCRYRPAVDRPRGKSFDPITPLLQPLVTVPLGFAARRFTRDEYQVFPIVPDLIEAMFQDPHAGGCALGPAGEVACVLGCNGRGVYTVKLPPVVDVRSDAVDGYGVTASGELWTWPRVPVSCVDPDAPVFRGEIAARRVELPPVAQLAPLVHYEGLRKFGTDVRCVALRDGTVRCWEDLGKLFDPAR